MAQAIILSTPSQKSLVREWADKVLGHGGSKAMERVKHHVSAGGQAVRAGGEAVVVGGLLGVAHSSLPHGLDYEVGSMPVPIDGVVAGLGLIGSAVMGPQIDSVATDLRNAGAAGAAILSFRKSAAWMHERRALAGMQTGGQLPPSGQHGEMGEDPIVRRAREISRGR